MSKARKKSESRGLPEPAPGQAPSRTDFDVVLGLIDAARSRAVAAVNTALIELYWTIGEHITHKIADDGWGKGTVEALADYIQRRQPNAQGFSARNLWRMMQFYETYRGRAKLSPLVTELSWTHNLLIMSRCKREEEREFYLRSAIREKWGKRELERQLAGALFERTVLSPAKLSPAVTKLHPDAATVFKDSYLVEFLQLPSEHSESDLERALVEKLKQFLIELGRDFCFVGSQYPLQVGGRDFSIDLLFFNRALNCLVAFDLHPVRYHELSLRLRTSQRNGRALLRRIHEGPPHALRSTRSGRSRIYCSSSTAQTDLLRGVPQSSRCNEAREVPEERMGQAIPEVPSCRLSHGVKIDEFQPEHLGKLEFYLEALDRDVKKPHERPSVGVLLCATKDHEVVEYALSRAMSPAIVAEYQTRLPDKKLLQAKLHEFYALAQAQAALPAIESAEPVIREPGQPRKRRKK